MFNTNAPTLNMGGAATTVNIGATTGTATINNATLSLPHATAINAANAALSVTSASIGGGYGPSSTGVTIDTNGNIKANGTLTVDNTSVLTGDVTMGGNLAVNGGISPPPLPVLPTSLMLILRNYISERGHQPLVWEQPVEQPLLITL